MIKRVMQSLALHLLCEGPLFTFCAVDFLAKQRHLSSDLFCSEYDWSLKCYPLPFPSFSWKLACYMQFHIFLRTFNMWRRIVVIATILDLLSLMRGFKWYQSNYSIKIFSSKFYLLDLASVNETYLHIFTKGFIIVIF